jgi:hypothetical protein
MTPGTVGWRDALDGPLVVFVVYRVCALFRGTRRGWLRALRLHAHPAGPPSPGR